jgi:hypothetical protein
MKITTFARHLPPGSACRWSLGLLLVLAAAASPAADASAAAAAAAAANDAAQRDAALACINAPTDARSDCVQDQLARHAAQQGVIADDNAARSAAARILSACNRLIAAERPACVDRELAAVPQAARTLARAELEEAQAAAAAAEQQRLAQAREACRRAGLLPGQVRVGMTAAQVEDCGWGAPLARQRSNRLWRTIEQWSYPQKRSLQLEGGKVTKIQG